MFILTLDKITWILFNRKVNMNKSLQSLHRQGFHGISNKLPKKKSACFQKAQAKPCYQTKPRTFLQFTTPIKGLKQRKLYVHRL